MHAPRIIVDGDPGVYRAGHAAQSVEQEIIWEDPLGEIHSVYTGSDSREMRACIAFIGGEVLEAIKLVTKKPWSIARDSIDTQMEGIYRECRLHFKERMVGGDPGMELILSGTGNYRESIATILKYKGNRDGVERPYWYKRIREHMIQTWGAYVVHEREADDEVAIRLTRYEQAGIPSILVTIDKDLDQVPGWHYDYKNHVFYHVDEVEGEILFFAQIISGDSTDNIPGIWKMGPAKSKKLVAEWQADWADDPRIHRRVGMSEYLWRNVVKEYTKHGVRDYAGPKNGEEIALEIAQLIYMQRFPGELWMPPGVERGTTRLNADD